MSVKTAKKAEKPTHFYKYVTAKAATEVLKNGTVRFSSPSEFNDPFDVQHDLQVPFSKEDLLNAVRQRFKGMIANGRSAPLNVSLDVMRKINEHFDYIMEQSSKTVREKLFEEEIPNFIRLYESIIETTPLFNKNFKNLLKEASFFCVSEMPNNLLMWAHYADSHQGAVIKLNCFPEKNTGLSSLYKHIKKVNYTEDIPPYHTLEGYIDNILGVSPLTTDHYLDALAYTKSADWEYEREWRVIEKLNNTKNPNNCYWNRKILPEEIDEIVFGCRMSDKDQKNIAAIISEKYSGTVIKVAVKHSTKFALDYVPYEGGD